MKLRNVRRRQWRRFSDKLIALEERGAHVCGGHGIHREWVRRTSRRQAKIFARIKYEQRKEVRQWFRDEFPDMWREYVERHQDLPDTWNAATAQITGIRNVSGITVAIDEAVMSEEEVVDYVARVYDVPPELLK